MPDETVTLAQIIQATAEALTAREAAAEHSGEGFATERDLACAVIAAVLPMLADAVEEGQIADRRERTAEANEARESGNDDKLCEESAHMECHMAAAFAGWGDAARLIRRIAAADPAEFTVERRNG